MHFYACNDFNGATLNLQQRKLNISLTLLSFMEKALALVTHENKTFLLLWIRFQLLNSKVTLSKIVLITAIWGGIWKLWTSKKESCTKRRCIQKTLKKGPSNGVISCTCIIRDLQIRNWKKYIWPPTFSSPKWVLISVSASALSAIASESVLQNEFMKITKIMKMPVAVLKSEQRR